MRSSVRHPPYLAAWAAMVALVFFGFVAFVGAGSTSSVAQPDLEVSVEFRTALEPYGRWRRHSRWGDVWAPADRPGAWRPYTVGRWVHTDEWGWYWNAAEAEASWGWIVYHYGRWVRDPDLGWVWVPGREWAPGWVTWRRGSDYVGWAPLPPDPIVVQYSDEPDVWFFVRARDFTAPRLVSVILPPRTVFFTQTVVVNRTILVRDRRFAVNPGIPAPIIAARIGRPLPTFEVRPRVLAGTTQIQGAIELRPEQIRNRGAAGKLPRDVIKQTARTVKPVGRVPDPEPLGADEGGRLGAQPPRAARDAENAGPDRDGQKGQAKAKQKQDAAKAKQEEARDKAKAKREDARQNAKEKADAAKAKQEEARDKAKAKRDAARQNAKEKADRSKAKQEAAREKAKAKRDEARQNAKEKGDASKAKQEAAREKADAKREGARQKKSTRGQEAEGRAPRQPEQTNKPPTARKERPNPQAKGRDGGERNTAPTQRPEGAPNAKSQPRTEGRSERSRPQAGPPAAAPNRTPPQATQGRGAREGKGRDD